MSEGESRICVLGLGNLMRTDDAAGMLALRRLNGDARFSRDVEVVEGETLGLDLLHDVYGVSHLLVLDAVDTGATPGTLTRFQGEEVLDLPTSKSVHLLGLSDLIQVLRLMDAPPMQIVLLGVQPESTEWGTVLTPAVEAAQVGLVEAALLQLAQWQTNLAGAALGEVPNSASELVAT
jgi:hydrogenase maturation protease